MRVEIPGDNLGAFCMGLISDLYYVLCDSSGKSRLKGISKSNFRYHFGMRLMRMMSEWWLWKMVHARSRTQGMCQALEIPGFESY